MRLGSTDDKISFHGSDTFFIRSRSSHWFSSECISDRCCSNSSFQFCKVTAFVLTSCFGCLQTLLFPCSFFPWLFHSLSLQMISFLHQYEWCSCLKPSFSSSLAFLYYLLMELISVLSFLISSWRRFGLLKISASFPSLVLTNPNRSSPNVYTIVDRMKASHVRLPLVYFPRSYQGLHQSIPIFCHLMVATVFVVFCCHVKAPLVFFAGLDNFALPKCWSE